MKATWPVPPELRVVAVNGYPLAIRDAGAGDALLLIHGSLSDYRSWNAQIAHFSGRFRVLAPSLRHCFPEPWDGSGNDYSLRQHADDLVGLLDAVGVSSAHVVGHSRGGAVALSLLDRYRGKLRSLTLADPRGLEALLGGTQGTAAEDKTEIAAAFAALRRNLAAGDVEHAARTFVDALSGAGAWDRRNALEKSLFLDNVATSTDPGELPHLDPAALGSLTMPTLLMTGARSPQRYAQMFSALRTLNSRIAPPIVIADAAHAMQRENAAAFNATLMSFLLAVG